jgi:hypothetical protein
MVDIGSRAAEIGVAEEVISAARTIFSRIKENPKVFGSPMYRLKKMRMHVYNMTVRPLYFEFGVHDDQPVVVVRRVVWISDPGSA